MIRLPKYFPSLNGMLVKDKSAFRLIWEQIIGLMTYQTPIVLQDAATISWDVSKAYNAQVTLAGSRTLVLNGLVAGDYGTLEVIQGGSGSYTLTLPTSPVSKVSDGGAGTIVLTTTVGAIDVLVFYYNGTNLLWNKSLNYT
jgi:hypothetical protein